MPKKKKFKLPVIHVPKTLEQATKFLGYLGEEQRSVDLIQTKLNADVEELKTKAIQDAEKHQAKINQLMEGLFAFAESHRDQLTENSKRKTIETPKGTFGWRITPPAVSLRNVKGIIEMLKSLNLEQFIRVKEQVNKEAMLKEPELACSINGVSIKQKEEFIVKVAELDIEIISQPSKLKKALDKRNS